MGSQNGDIRQLSLSLESIHAKVGLDSAWWDTSNEGIAGFLEPETEVIRAGKGESPVLH